MHLYNYGSINNFLNPPKKAFHLNEEWDEGLVTFKTQPEINWDAGSEPFEGLEFNTWETIEMRYIVSDIIVGDSTNKGFSVSTFGYNYGGCKYYSSEHEVQELRPKMEILISDNLSPKIELLTLNGEEDVEAGTEELVKWEASDDGAISAVVIHFNIDNEWVFLDSITDGSTELVWKIPIYKYRKRCFFRLTAYDNTGKYSTDMSDEAFIIEKPTSIVAKSANIASELQIFEQGSSLNLQIDKALPTEVAIFNVKGQVLSKFKTTPSVTSYKIDNIGSEKLLIFRLQNSKEEQNFRFIR